MHHEPLRHGAPGWISSVAALSAVRIVRDVLGFHASEVAAMLEVTLESDNSALTRARGSLQRRQQSAVGRQSPPPAGSPVEEAIVAKFARAWESAGVRGLPARPGRHAPRDRLLRAHPGRRRSLRHDPLRGQRAALVRATPIPTPSYLRR